ncbi:unnamed protein product [Amaranthus hypochondriacus]
MKDIASLVHERSYVDLKSEVAINGVCYMFLSNVKCLVSNHSTTMVWSAGVLSFVLWEFLQCILRSVLAAKFEAPAHNAGKTVKVRDFDEELSQATIILVHTHQQN